MLDETSPELLDALDHTLRLLFGKPQILTACLNTGGGCMVAAVDLSIDGRFMGRQLWLTRENDDWILGVYDFYMDEEDQGICMVIPNVNDYSRVGPAGEEPRKQADDPLWVAAQVAAILARLGVDKLQGE